MDVQNLKPHAPFRITRVGMRGIKKPLHVVRNGKEHVLSATIDVFVDLPETQKGSHMSRNAEAINEVVDRSIRQPCDSIESVAAHIGDILLERHPYASRSEVRIEADYFIDRTTPAGNPTVEHYEIYGGAVCARGEDTVISIGVRVVGMTACPCAMETVRKMVRESGDGYPVPDGAPFITHNQRNIVNIELSGRELGVDAEELIDIAEESVSSPTYEILKRDGEGMVVLNAHKNPRFVEDVVRCALDSILQRFPQLADDVVITVRSESEESIHKHSAFAERIARMGELRE